MNKEMNSTIGIGVGVAIVILIVVAGILFMNRQPPLNPHGIAASSKQGGNPAGAVARRGFGQARGTNPAD